MTHIALLYIFLCAYNEIEKEHNPKITRHCFYVKGPMAHHMVQEDAFWLSVMIRFGPHWHNSKITLLMQYGILALNHNKLGYHAYHRWSS